MTDLGSTGPDSPGELASLEALEPLEPLEPLDAGGADGSGATMCAGDATLQALRSGMPTPAFNPYCRDKAFYKFLFAGVLIFLGCLMPFGPNYQQIGYKTMSGAVYMVIAVGMIWTWWGAIHNNRSSNASLKWLLLCVIPLVAGIMNLIGFDPDASLKLAQLNGTLPNGAEVSTWKTLATDMFAAGRPSDEAPLAAARVENFWRLFGPGRFFVFLGSLVAELGFFGGVLGGAKKNKQVRQQKQMTASERKRR
ncbi:MAG: hypothetical protein ABIP94_21610 [Planctomycetota bacterium]